MVRQHTTELSRSEMASMSTHGHFRKVFSSTPDIVLIAVLLLQTLRNMRAHSMCTTVAPEMTIGSVRTIPERTSATSGPQPKTARNWQSSAMLPGVDELWPMISCPTCKIWVMSGGVMCCILPWWYTPLSSMLSFPMVGDCLLQLCMMSKLGHQQWFDALLMMMEAKNKLF